MKLHTIFYYHIIWEMTIAFKEQCQMFNQEATSAVLDFCFVISLHLSGGHSCIAKIVVKPALCRPKKHGSIQTKQII